MLTQRQADVLRYIEGCIVENGQAPTYREISAACGLISPSAAHKIVEALKQRGFVRRIGAHRAARGLEVIKPQTHLNAEYIRGYRDALEAEAKSEK
jgi:SOS-response transcriptional repressor LexA